MTVSILFWTIWVWWTFWETRWIKNVFGTYIVDKKRIYFENIYVDFI